MAIHGTYLLTHLYLQVCRCGDLGWLWTLGEAGSPAASVVRDVELEVGHADDRQCAVPGGQQF